MITNRPKRRSRKSAMDAVRDPTNPRPKAALWESRPPMLDVPATFCVGCGSDDFSAKGFYREAGWTEVSRTGNHLTPPLVRFCFTCYDSWRGITFSEAM